MKFSIVIPIYNVEKYIEKCLNSIKNQSYDNYEVILINDGSKENEEKKIKKFLDDKKFKYFKKENGGLSDARNYGVKYVTGDYLIFVDSDDFIESDLLEKLNNELKSGNPDIIKYMINITLDDGSVIDTINNHCFSLLNKNRSIRKILNDLYIEPAWMYCYKVSFYKKNKFTYPKGKIHEDFALTPIILSKARSFKSINVVGYNYVQRENSIMNDKNYQKIIKRVDDFKEHYLYHKDNLDLKYRYNRDLLGYSAFSMICKVRELKPEDQKEYIEFIKKEKLVRKITFISFKRYLMKIYLFFFLEKYINKLTGEYHNEG